MKRIVVFIITLVAINNLWAQTKIPAVSLSGSVGISYEGYRLSTNPSTPEFYSPRRPSDLVRFIFQPELSFGDFKLPFNFNFSPMRNNFGSPPFGFGNSPGFPKQSFKQWITNPVNNLSVNPSFKYTEILLGTQYLKYSELSTGDIGTFGFGINLKPGKFRVKLFRGFSQLAYLPFVNTVTGDKFAGVFTRSITMGQIGLEQEGRYFTGFNLVKSKDDPLSIDQPMTGVPSTPNPSENFIVSFVTRFNTDKGWYGQTEMATTFTSKDLTAQDTNPLVKDFKPFISSNVSSFRDHAVLAGFGKKGKGWDVGLKTKWLGAGYYSMGFPFTQNDRIEYTFNSRFVAWKKRINVIAKLGQRFNQVSDTTNRSSQIIINTNVFTQFNEHISLNVSYNNYGFQSRNVLGIKNVGNDLSINPSYTWSSDKMSHLINLSYNWSVYDETVYATQIITSNNSHTILLLYVPVFFEKANLSTDLSTMWFKNTSTTSANTLRILGISGSLGYNFPKQNLSLNGQLQFNNCSVLPYTASNNFLLSFKLKWTILKKLTWNTLLTINLFKYGDELSPPLSLLGAQYMENTLRTSLLYRFGK